VQKYTEMFSSIRVIRFASDLAKTDLKYVIPRFNYSSDADKIVAKPKLSTTYVNKNPRNLEWSGHQYKRFGWNLQYPPKDYYHQCSFRRVRNYLEGIVEHSSGQIVAKASTQETALLQYLTSPRDMSAAINLGRLLADRCLKFGINNMSYQKSISFESSKREQAFYNALEQNGIKFEEPEFKEQPANNYGLDYENKDFYNDKKDLPFPPLINRQRKNQ